MQITVERALQACEVEKPADDTWYAISLANVIQKKRVGALRIFPSEPLHRG